MDEKTRQQLHCGYEQVPERILDEIDRYVYKRIAPGSFIKSILCNDLMGAVTHSGPVEQPHIADIVKYLYNRCPSACRGNARQVSEWLDGAYSDIF